ncbi:uncharacterized protein LOC135208169 [Macrobrachium nipponense]|uniref:uncharacterized protein LOC135208169 n=1 Tax=Macrobrachium nipponense TaxID=159736 RepID=UPI0030C87E87
MVSALQMTVLVAGNREELEGKLERWRYALESRGIRISRKMTQYMTTELDSDQQITIKLGRGNIKRVHKFKYLGSVIASEGNMEEEINNRIQCAWNNWRKVWIGSSTSKESKRAEVERNQDEDA